MSKKFYIVWNDARNEGFITDNEDDAVLASSGDVLAAGVSIVGQAMYDTYSEDGDLDIELTIQEVSLEPPK